MSCFRRPSFSLGSAHTEEEERTTALRHDCDEGVVFSLEWSFVFWLTLSRRVELVDCLVGQSRFPILVLESRRR